MRITYLGHAGLRVDGADLRLLMDPWLSRTGAFQASWYQFPANAHLDQVGLLDCDYVTVSHEHLDHMDTAVLASLGPATTVLIPRVSVAELPRPSQGGWSGQPHRGAGLAQIPAQRARRLADLHY